MTGDAPIDVFRVHGGRIDRARAMFGGDDWIDLSTGIAPYAYPCEPCAAAFTALPDPDALAQLEAAAGAAFGATGMVVAVPGSDLALRLIARLFEGRPVAVVRPGYGGHVAIWPKDRMTEISADDLEAAATTADVILLANPNNPDGRVIEPERLTKIAAKLAERSGWLIVDEAFADAAEIPSPDSPSPRRRLGPMSAFSSGPHEAIDMDPSLRWGDDIGAKPSRLAPNVICLRSFGKFFGVPGLRLGFVLAPPAIAQTLRSWLGDWPISGPAIAIGTAAYRDLDWQVTQRSRLATDAARLDALLTAAGLEARGGTPLFRLIETEHANALFRHLAAAHILTRPFADNHRRLRIGLPGSEDHWTRLTHALDAWRE